MDKKGQWSQLGNEIWNDFLKTVTILGIILAAVVIFRIWAASPWLLVIMIVFVLLAWLFYKGIRAGWIRI